MLLTYSTMPGFTACQVLTMGARQVALYKLYLREDAQQGQRCARPGREKYYGYHFVSRSTIVSTTHGPDRELGHLNNLQETRNGSKTQENYLCPTQGRYAVDWKGKGARPKHSTSRAAPSALTIISGHTRRHYCRPQYASFAATTTGANHALRPTSTNAPPRRRPHTAACAAGPTTPAGASTYRPAPD